MTFSLCDQRVTYLDLKMDIKMLQLNQRSGYAGDSVRVVICRRTSTDLHSESCADYCRLPQNGVRRLRLVRCSKDRLNPLPPTLSVDLTWKKGFSDRFEAHLGRVSCLGGVLQAGPLSRNYSRILACLANPIAILNAFIVITKW